jgi:hypothetical protein
MHPLDRALIGLARGCAISWVLSLDPVKLWTDAISRK